MTDLLPSDALGELFFPPDEDEIYQGMPEEYLVPLGYTLYRTDYSSGTEAAWLALVETMEERFKQEVSSCFKDSRGTPKEDEALEKLFGLVRIDARSDEAILANCTLDQLRTIFNDHVGGTPLNPQPNNLRRVFLVADKTVFEALAGGKSWVKAVEVNYDAAQHYVRPGSRMMMSQKYWGWMKVSTKSLYFLWNDLHAREIWKIAPKMDKTQQNSCMYNGGHEDFDFY